MELTSIDFSVLGENEIRNIAVLNITESDIYGENGAISGGLRDELMGPTAMGKDNVCSVCNLSVNKCAGHFGCIEFPVHLWHINRIPLAIKELKTKCHKCFETINKKKCTTCKTPAARITWDAKKNVLMVNNKPKLAHETVEWLGEKSKTLLMKNMLCPPNSLRPPPTVGGEEIMGEDTTTRGLLQILRTVKSLNTRVKSKDPQNIIRRSAANLQKHVDVYLDRQRATKTRGGQSIADRLRGKRGRLRGNTMGKRCNFTARTVVTGDARLGLREVGVPKSIADNVTKRVKVSKLNQGYLMDLLKEGKVKTVYRGDRMFDLSKKKGQTYLYVGDSVDRSLQDGDFVLFNRQPSLHKMSIMAHRVRILPYSTFRLNLSATTPYNADFDGDEMNLHGLQSLECEAEMASIMAIEHNFITPSSHRPVMSIVQDTLLALYEISHPDYYFDFESMIQWHFAAGIEGQPPTERRKYSGLEVLSFSLPKDLNYTKKDFVVEQGKIISGRITKGIMGRSDGSLVHCIVLDYGGNIMCDIIDQFQRGVSEWSHTMGFSIGIQDMIPAKTTTREIQKACDKAYASISPDDSEHEINMKLNSARDTMGKLAIKNTPQSNRLRRIVESGTKGSLVNIMQVVAAVAQQNCKGQRMQPVISGRTLPCFTADDNGGRARGFVRSPYITGLTADEYFFHAVGGREGLCDTAIKTSQTGYLTRRLSKSLESLVVMYDLSVRDSSGNVIQFLYGEDGFDATKIERDGQETPVQVPMRRILKKYADGKDEGPHKPITFKNNKRLNKYIREQVKKAPPMSKIAYFKVCKEAQKKWDKGKVEAGQAVGIIAAQSVGEPVTQMTLNTFHNAGNSGSNVTLGMPRFEALVNASSSAKIKRNFFKVKSKKKAFALMNNIRETKIEHFVEIARIKEAEEEEVLSLYRMFPDEPITPLEEKNKWMVTLRVSRKAMAQRNTELKHIVDAIRDCSRIKVEVHWCAPKVEDPYMAIYFLNNEMNKKVIRSWMNTCLGHTLFGIKGIENAIITKEGVETVGSNLLEAILIDLKATSDDIWDVLAVLGVEAARETLKFEIQRVLTANGAYVSARHIMLLCDWMTHEGSIRGTTRFGQKSAGPLARASYEQPVEILQKAGLNQLTDPIAGVSQQIMFGKKVKIGGELCGMVTDVKTETKPVETHTWSGNFQFSRKKRKPPTLMYNPPRERAAPFQPTPMAAPASHPWMMAQSW